MRTEYRKNEKKNKKEENKKKKSILNRAQNEEDYCGEADRGAKDFKPLGFCY